MNGPDDGGNLIENEAEQNAIKEMSSLRGQQWTLRAIAERMSKNGFTLSHEGVKKIINAYNEAAEMKARENGTLDISFAIQSSQAMADAFYYGTVPPLAQGPEAEARRAREWMNEHYRRQVQKQMDEDWNA